MRPFDMAKEYSHHPVGRCGLIYPGYLGLHHSVVRGFEAHGWQVDCWEPFYWHDLAPLSKINYRIHQWVGRLELYRISQKTAWFKRNAPRLRDTHYDLLVILKGDWLTPEIMRAIRAATHAPIIVWAYDSTRRYPSIAEICRYADHTFIFEPEDAAHLMGTGCRSVSYLPVGFDDSAYHPATSESKQDIDIFFCGKTTPGSRRYNYLARLCREARTRGWNVLLALPAWSRIFGLLDWMRYHSDGMTAYIRNVELRPDELCSFYHRAKICLNIHDEQSVRGYNPRTLDILAAGSLQLVDAKGQILQDFVPREVLATFDTEDDMIKRIQHYLDHSEERLDIAARARAMEKSHLSMRACVKQIISMAFPGWDDAR
jgi:spore maturation protein CgeB